MFSGKYGNITADDKSLKFDIDYNYITNEDMKDMTGFNGYGCFPNTGIIDKFLKYTTGTITKSIGIISGTNIQFKGPLEGKLDELIKKGLSYINFSYTQDGTINEIKFDTKPALRYSEDLIKFKRRMNLL